MERADNTVSAGCGMDIGTETEANNDVDHLGGGEKGRTRCDRNQKAGTWEGCDVFVNMCVAGRTMDGGRGGKRI